MLPGLVDALLGHLALGLLLQLRVEFLHPSTEALHLLVLGLATLYAALQPQRSQPAEITWLLANT